MLMDDGRRAFLRGRFLTGESRRREARRRPPLGPPPPWHRGEPLERACPDCDRPCVAICTTGVIRIHPPTHALAGLPYLDFHATGCTFCGACRTACPLTAATGTDQQPTPVIGRVELIRSACLAWNGVICMACIGRCEARALVADRQRRVRVDAARCTGCGQCVAACPNSALHVA
jgi:ferredoxin-type protein NapF